MAIEGLVSVTCGKKKALIIGIGYKLKKLAGLGRLREVYGDARSLVDLLRDSYGYAEKDITLMLDERNDGDAAMWPTRDNVRTQIDLLVKDASPGDQFFFYYAGHGHQERCRHNSETDGLDEAMDTCDGKKILDNELKERLVRPLPPGSKLFALIDSCHSETMLDLDEEPCEACRRLRLARHRGRKHNTLLTDIHNRMLVLHQEQHQSARARGASLGRCDPLPSRAQQQLKRADSPEPRRRHNSLTRPRDRVPARAGSEHSYLPKAVSHQMAYNVREAHLSRPAACKCTTKGRLDHDAHVISLSACRDNESAFDDNVTGGTMTKFFIETLEEDRHPSLKKLLAGVRKRVHNLTRRRELARHQTLAIVGPVVEVRETVASDPIGHAVQTNGDEDMIVVSDTGCSQHPRYGSRCRLNLNEPFDP
ncbi:hypothetical protein BV22DRAFT_195585 [Leucogyrophana mollusca]|uniref:Uncharacterized protein n=1 Tax=Leucogyrophana mollusca TaxID=85980 RepID=A0ACB8BRR2_9AGAM|nr:hypothetical protein BV22DRAFT_195585 [Leucogyrophana mollusca]